MDPGGVTVKTPPRSHHRPLSAPSTGRKVSTPEAPATFGGGKSRAVAGDARSAPKARPTSAPPARPVDDGKLKARFEREVQEFGSLGDHVAKAANRLKLFSLPIQSTICRELETILGFENRARCQIRAQTLLGRVKGEHGDFRDCGNEDIDDLVPTLIAGGMHADVTRMLCDPHYLQRRLALSSMRKLLSDFDACESALEDLVRTEPIHRRSSNTNASLSRKMYLSSLRKHLGDITQDYDGQNSQKFLKSLKKTQFANSLGVVVGNLMNVIQTSIQWFESRSRDMNHPLQIRLPLREEVRLEDFKPGEVEEGLRAEIAHEATVDSARLAVRLEYESSDEQVFYAVVTVLPLVDGRGRLCGLLAQQVARQCSEPMSDLYLGKYGRLLDAEFIGEDPPRPEPGSTAASDFSSILSMKQRLAHAQKIGLIGCLDHLQYSKYEDLVDLIEAALVFEKGKDSAKELFPYRFLIANVPGFVRPRRPLLAEMAMEITDATNTPDESVCIEITNEETGPDGEKLFGVTALLPAQLKESARVHNQWMSKYKVTGNPSQQHLMIKLVFAKSVPKDIDDEAIVAALNLTTKISTPSASIQISWSQSRRRLTMELPFCPVVTKNDEDVFSRIKSDLLKQDCQVRELLKDYLLGMQFLDGRSDPFAVFPPEQSLHVEQIIEQELIMDSLVVHFARRDSRVRVINRLISSCTRLEDGFDGQRRLLFLEGESGSGKSALLARFARDVGEKMHVIAAIRKPGQKIDDFMEFVGTELGLRIFGPTYQVGEHYRKLISSSSDAANFASLRKSSIGGSSPTSNGTIVFVLDGLSNEEQEKVILAWLGVAENEPGGYGWATRLADLSKLMRDSTLLLSSEKVPNDLLEINSAETSCEVVQLEDLALPEELFMAKVHSHDVSGGNVTGVFKHGLKTLEDFLTVHHQFFSDPQVRNKLPPLTPQWVASAVHHVLNSRAQQPMDENFPLTMNGLAKGLFQGALPLEHAREVLSILISQQQGMTLQELQKAVSPGCQESVKKLLKGWEPVMYAPYVRNAAEKVWQTTFNGGGVRYAIANESIRKEAQIFLRSLHLPKMIRDLPADRASRLITFGMDALEDGQALLDRLKVSGTRSRGIPLDPQEHDDIIPPPPSPSSLQIRQLNGHVVALRWSLSAGYASPAEKDVIFEAELRGTKGESTDLVCLEQKQLKPEDCRDASKWHFCCSFVNDRHHHHIKPDKPYLIRVRTSTKVSSSAWRTTTLATPSIPAAPTLDVLDITSHSVHLVWQAGAGSCAVTGFLLQVHLPGKDGFTTVYEGRGTEYVINNLQDATIYRIRICAQNASDHGPWKKQEIRTAVTPAKLLSGAAKYLTNTLRIMSLLKGGKGQNEIRQSAAESLRFFKREGDPGGFGTWRGASRRELGLLLSSLIEDGVWTELQNLLLNPLFLQKVIRELGVDYLQVNVCQRALNAFETHPPTGNKKQLEEFRAYLHKLQHVCEAFAHDLTFSKLSFTQAIASELAGHASGSFGRAALAKVCDGMADGLESFAKDLLQKAQSTGEGGPEQSMIAKIGHGMTELEVALIEELHWGCSSSDAARDRLASVRDQLQAWFDKEGEKRLETEMKNLMNQSENDPVAENAVDVAKDLGILMDMRGNSLEMTGKALIRLELMFELPHHQHARPDQEPARRLRSELLSALYEYVTEQYPGQAGITLRLVRLEPILSQDAADEGTEPPHSLAVIQVAVDKNSASEVHPDLHVRVAHQIVEALHDENSKLFQMLQHLVASSEVKQAVTEASRFLVIGMACSMKDLQVRSKEFRNRLRLKVAEVCNVEEKVVRVLKVTKRRTYAVIELLSGSVTPVARNAGQRSPSLSDQDGNAMLLEGLKDMNVVYVSVVDGSVPPLLPGERISVKLFNSSTFSDMHAERNFLNNYVYPAIRGACKRRRIDFSWIDFRWGGVTAQDSSQGLGVLKCLQKIDDCVLPLQHGITIPVVVGLIGERGGWMPSPDSKDREEAAKHYQWMKDKQYLSYSVTGLEMAHAFFRLPHSSETFFFLRDSRFVSEPSFQQVVPQSAKAAFMETSHDSQEFVKQLRKLAEGQVVSRVHHYCPQLKDPPFQFSTRAAIKMVHEFREAVTSSKAPNKHDAQWQLMRWWRLIEEEAELRRQHPSAYGDQEDRESIETEFQECLKDELCNGLKENGGMPKLGPTNVSAHGIKLTFPQLGWQVMVALQEMFDAYFPASTAFASNYAHLEDRNFHESCMEEYALSFAHGTRSKQLLELENWLFDEKSNVIAVLEGLPASGRTAFLSKFCFDRSFQSDKIVQQHLDEGQLKSVRRGSDLHFKSQWVFVYYFSSAHVALDDVLQYLATEILVQANGKQALTRKKVKRKIGDHFREALIEVLKLYKVLIVVDGLEGLALKEFLRITSETWNDNFKDVHESNLRVLSSADCGNRTWTTIQDAAQFSLFQLHDLDEEEKKEICRSWMKRFGKENVSDQQLDKAIHKKESNLALYLVLFSAEAAQISVYERVEYEMSRMEDSIQSLWSHRTLPRLEQTYGSGLVRFVMMRLLTNRKGLKVSELKRMVGDQQLDSQGAMNTAALLEQLTDALLPFLRPGRVEQTADSNTEETISFDSNLLYKATKHKYAPNASEQEKLVEQRKTAHAMTQLFWREQRLAVVDSKHAAVQKPPAPAEEDQRTQNLDFLWAFDKTKKHSRIILADADGRQIKYNNMKESLASALVTPLLPKDSSSYFEVAIESTGDSSNECKIRVGIALMASGTAKNVPHKLAASSDKNCWLFDCNSGNLANGGKGHKFIDLKCSVNDHVGLYVQPIKGEVLLYINSKYIDKLPISVGARHMMKTEDICFAVDLFKNNQMVRIVRQEPDFVPELPPAV